MKITTKLASNSNVTFVTHKHFAILFFLLSCCINSLLSHSGLQGTGYHAKETKRRAWNVNVTLFYTHHFLIIYFHWQINVSKTILSEAVNTTIISGMSTGHKRKKKRKKKRKEKDNVFEACLCCMSGSLLSTDWTYI